MTRVQTLYKQTENAYSWVNDLAGSLPESLWDKTPDALATNMTWMTGHLILSYYYHTVIVIVGQKNDLAMKHSLREYNRYFSYGSTPTDAVGKVDISLLKQNHQSIQQESLQVISRLSDTDLDCALETPEMPHPIAGNKFEALDWNIKHTMWHCGQMAMLKRVVDKRHDFNLKLNK